MRTALDVEMFFVTNKRNRSPQANLEHGVDKLVTATLH